MNAKAILLAVVVLGGLAAGVGSYWPFGGKYDVLRLPGMVEVHEVRLAPRIGGRVKEILVNESETVQTGQPLVRLEVPELQAQREILRAKVSEARAELARADAGPRQQEKDSARAAVGAARARLVRLQKGYREEEKQQGRSEFAAAQADHVQARKEYDRARRLLTQGAGTRTEMDLVTGNLERTQGKLATAKARLDMLLSGSRQEDIDEAREELARLDAQLRLLEAGTRSEEKDIARARLREAEHRLAELEVNLNEAVVRAAEPCLVELILVRCGDVVVPSQPVVKALRNADLWVKTYVPETDLGKVRIGQDVKVTIDSFPGVRFAGQVTHIGTESEFTPRNVQTVDERRHQMFGIRVKVADTQGRFKSGMAAEVYVPVSREVQP